MERMEIENRIINELRKHSNGFVVYDIDGTLIDNFGNPRMHIVRTYHYALKKGLKPVIITARIGTLENIHYTEQELFKHGIKNYSEIYFMPQSKKDQAKYKYFARKNVFKKGKIVASIGDMPWDYGEYGGVGFQV